MWSVLSYRKANFSLHFSLFFDYSAIIFPVFHHVLFVVHIETYTFLKSVENL